MPFLNLKKPFRFGTKAETLSALKSLVASCHIPRFYYFAVPEWKKDRQRILKKISAEFSRKKVIVRSSAVGEDGDSASLAGQFTSVSHIQGHEDKALDKAISKVIGSYKKGAISKGKPHQIMVQDMVSNISMSGVVLTQDLNTGAPYYVINYDDCSGRTDTVTSGADQGFRTLFVHRSSVTNLESPRFRALLKVIQELEAVTGHDALDIEFAVDMKNIVHLLQVRPIATRPNWNRSITMKVDDAIARMRKFVENTQRDVPGIYGACSIFGNMPDWNPAEMIGTSPRPLALSLYRYLITDFAWREARRLMGYHEPKGTRLMVSLMGKPYIDVRLSFNSFLPMGVSPVIGHKLVNAWLDRLANEKALHDKVEFDIVTTVRAFDFEERVKKQFPGVLSKSEAVEYKKLLGNLTKNLITGRIASIEEQLEKIRILEKRREELLSGLKRPSMTVVSGLLEDCITYGTIPFSILARHAFIATSFLKSLVSRGVITAEESNFFKKTIKTVAGEFVDDIHAAGRGHFPVGDFMKKYGHLRPGTYDILSRRYDRRENLISGFSHQTEKSKAEESFQFSKKQLSEIAKLLNEFGYGIAPSVFLQYVKDAIASREYAKFVFTRNISDALEIIEHWGERIGLSLDELSFIPIHDLKDTANTAEGRTLEHFLRGLAIRGREAHEITSAVRLPYLIEKPEDSAIIPLLINKPNFITKKIIQGESIFLSGCADQTPELADKIVLIEGADPGFDWIFSRPIRGLITKFGGANSHMTIRCAEFGLPAAIGCGEQIFDRVVRSHRIELNCSEERIESLDWRV